MLRQSYLRNVSYSLPSSRPASTASGPESPTCAAISRPMYGVKPLRMSTLWRATASGCSPAICSIPLPPRLARITSGAWARSSTSTAANSSRSMRSRRSTRTARTSGCASSSAACRAASSASSAIRTQPRPARPVTSASAFTTHGPASPAATARACSALSARSPSGMGMLTAASNCLPRCSSSRATRISGISATADIRIITAATADGPGGVRSTHRGRCSGQSRVVQRH